jgi:hypothetical protein
MGIIFVTHFDQVYAISTESPSCAMADWSANTTAKLPKVELVSRMTARDGPFNRSGERRALNHGQRETLIRSQF